MYLELGALSALTVAAAGLVACDRSPVPAECPDVTAGDLVLTELRGPQSGADGYGEWIELYNATGGAVDLQGVRLELTKLDGSSSGGFVVRAPTEVGAGAYAVLGRDPEDDRPDFVDYGYADDFDQSLFKSAAVELFACDVVVDDFIYRSLPTQGSLALDGAIDPPGAAANDDEPSWCPDTIEDGMSATLGLRGSPKDANPECPPP